MAQRLPFSHSSRNALNRRERGFCTAELDASRESAKFDNQNKMKKARCGNQKRACERQSKLVRAAGATTATARTTPAAATATAAGSAATTTTAARTATTTAPAAITASTTIATAWGGVGA